MPIKFQVKRGLYRDLPTLSVGQFGFCTDTKELFIGTVSGVNTLVGVSSEFEERVKNLEGAPTCGANIYVQDTTPEGAQENDIWFDLTLVR